MKSYIRKNKKIILGYMISEKNKKGLELICKSLNVKIKYIGKESENLIIKEIANSFDNNVQILNTQNTLCDECIILSGFSDNEIDMILTHTKKYAVEISLKCVVTKYNQDWKLCDLITELKKERSNMHQQ